MPTNSCLTQAFAHAADQTSMRLAWRAKDAAEHATWRRKFRRKLGDLMGRMPEPVTPEVRWGETVEKRGFTRHKIYVRAEEQYWIPAYYFVPHARAERAPALLCLHGHKGIVPYIREGTRAERRMTHKLSLDYAVYLAEHGYVTLAPVQRGWNETMHEGYNASPTDSCYRTTLDALLLGQTPVGLRVWDAHRLVDFLETRPEVDRRRIGAAGLSGGGMTTLYFVPFEPRIKVAIVAGYFCTLRESIFAIFHCICNAVPGIMEWGDLSDVAALIAPKPLLLINGKADKLHSYAGTRRAFRDLSRVYRLLDARDNLVHDFFDGGHRWNNRKTLAFLRKHLGATPETARELATATSSSCGR